MQRPTLNQAVAIATLATLAAPVGYWLFTRYETVADAQEHAKRDERRGAYLIYGQSKAETLTLRNRVNDCDGRPVKPGERAACDQYRREYEESRTRTEQLYNALHKGER